LFLKVFNGLSEKIYLISKVFFNFDLIIFHQLNFDKQEFLLDKQAAYQIFRYYSSTNQFFDKQELQKVKQAIYFICI